MALRIHEVHPSLVHYPLVLVPVSIIADLIGRVTGRRFFNRVGGTLMPVAAASGVVAAGAGLVAQSAVQAEGRAHDLLATHRNLNAGLVVLTGLMALLRSRRDEPSLGYLAAGVAAIAAMNYTAYLGGEMVYARGVGVEPAGGVREGESPEIHASNLPQIAKVAGHHVVESLEDAARHLREGEIAPSLGRHEQVH
jgi:uncharacterized membrane protein